MKENVDFCILLNLNFKIFNNEFKSYLKKMAFILHFIYIKNAENIKGKKNSIR